MSEEEGAAAASKLLEQAVGMAGEGEAPSLLMLAAIAAQGVRGWSKQTTAEWLRIVADMVERGDVIAVATRH